MIGYVTIGTNDLERAVAFYDELLAELSEQRQAHYDELTEACGQHGLTPGTDLLIQALPLEPDDVVADIGAGTGYFTFPIAARVPEGRVLAVDIQPEMLATVEARRATLNVTNVKTVLGTETDPNLVPPNDLIQPKRGFGKIWRTIPGIQDALGWATTPEFDLIRRLRDIVGETADTDRSGCLLGIGDDAALFRASPGEHLAVCTDTLVEGVHFPAGTHPGAIGYKALAVNLSDLAAMGAEPAWFLLALALPSGDEAWLDDFAQGLAALARDAAILLAGGDTTSGPLTVTVTAAGRLPAGTALTRHGALEGDDVYVSGLPGRAARALHDLESGVTPPAPCLRALEFPEPRLALGRSLRGVASACIDTLRSWRPSSSRACPRFASSRPASGPR